MSRRNQRRKTSEGQKRGMALVFLIIAAIGAFFLIGPIGSVIILSLWPVKNWLDAAVNGAVRSGSVFTGLVGFLFASIVLAAMGLFAFAIVASIALGSGFF